jgi:hypothetical protein
MLPSLRKRCYLAVLVIVFEGKKRLPFSKLFIKNDNILIKHSLTETGEEATAEAQPVQRNGRGGSHEEESARPHLSQPGHPHCKFLICPNMDILIVSSLSVPTWTS